MVNIQLKKTCIGLIIIFTVSLFWWSWVPVPGWTYFPGGPSESVFSGETGTGKGVSGLEFAEKGLKPGEVQGAGDDVAGPVGEVKVSQDGDTGEEDGAPGEGEVTRPGEKEETHGLETGGPAGGDEGLVGRVVPASGGARLEVRSTAGSYVFVLLDAAGIKKDFIYGVLHKDSSPYPSEKQPYNYTFEREGTEPGYKYVTYPAIKNKLGPGKYSLKFFGNSDLNRDLLWEVPLDIFPMVHITNPKLGGYTIYQKPELRGYISNYNAVQLDGLSLRLKLNDYIEKDITGTIDKETGQFSSPINLQEGINTIKVILQYSWGEEEGITEEAGGDIEYLVDECFIATAAFGSRYSPPVALLRQFRDQELARNRWGRALVNYYYQVSPSLAAHISSHSYLIYPVRALLLPVVAAVYLLLNREALLIALVIFLALSRILFKPDIKGGCRGGTG